MLLPGVLSTVVAIFVGEFIELEAAQAHWISEDDVRCGVHSLYAMLRLNRIVVNRAELEKEITLSDRGSSLYDLQQAALAHGLGTQVIRASPDSLPRVRLPAIAHLAIGENEGHYVILIDFQKPKANFGADPWLIDSTGELFEWNRGDFLRHWSGNLLVVAPRLRDRVAWTVVVICSGLVVVALCHALFRRLRWI